MHSPTTTPIRHRSMAHLVVVTGALMAAYLTLRPYGDARGADTASAAEAFASPLWIWSHLAGAAALVILAVLWALVTTGAFRWTALGSAALVLPYYGAETFALHENGAMALAEEIPVMPLVDPVRDNPVATTMFGAGLLALAVTGIVTAAQWRRRHDGTLSRSLAPLAAVGAMFLPQFFLPPAGRIAYGVAFAVAAAYAAYGLRSPADTTITRGTDVATITPQHHHATGSPARRSADGDIVE